LFYTSTVQLTQQDLTLFPVTLLKVLTYYIKDYTDGQRHF